MVSDTSTSGSRIADGTLRNCVAMNAADRFDPELTANWTEAIASAVESSDKTTADEFLQRASGVPEESPLGSTGLDAD